MRKTLFRQAFTLCLVLLVGLGLSQYLVADPKCETYLECEVDCHQVGPAVGDCTDFYGRSWDIFPCDVDNGICWYNPY